MSLEIRVAVSKDAPRLAVLLEELGYALTPAAVERERREAGTHVLVADDDGAVVGVLAMHTRRHFQMAAQASSIDALVVAESHRGKGVGSALVMAAFRVAADVGSARIDLNSSFERVEARRFYEDLGFEVVSHHFRRALASP